MVNEHVHCPIRFCFLMGSSAATVLKHGSITVNVKNRTQLLFTQTFLLYVFLVNSHPHAARHADEEAI
jgi:hypothetical protein